MFDPFFPQPGIDSGSASYCEACIDVWSKGYHVPRCPIHGEAIAHKESGCEVCDCRWLLVSHQADKPDETAEDLAEAFQDYWSSSGGP